MLSAVAVSLVPLGALAALGGAYSTSTIPIVGGAAAAFLVSRARPAGMPGARMLDAALMCLLGVIGLQAVPIPASAVAVISPNAASLQDMLAVQPPGSARPLSIDARLTREGLAIAAAAAMLFWAARETLSRGGVRVFTRATAWAGFAVSLVALVQRATAPTLLLWRWQPLDPGAQPFGPFVNRNHFATWLLMAAAVTTGYLVAHLRSHRFDRHSSRRLIVRDLLADGGALLLAGSLAVMLLALVTSLSRAALLGAGGAVAFGALVARRRQRDLAPTIVALTVGLILAAALWVNREGLLRRADATIGGEVGRPVIWRETLPIVADFWATGTGVGTYGSAMLRYQETRIGTLFNQAHNEYLQLLAEGGVLLSVVSLIAIAAWAGLARRRLARRGEPEWIRLGAAAGICGVAVQSLFEAGLRMPANALLFAVLAAIVVSEPRRLETD